MKETEILCKNCESERQRIEGSGDGKVISCEPLPGEERKADDKRRCKLVWEDSPL